MVAALHDSPRTCGVFVTIRCVRNAITAAFPASFGSGHEPLESYWEIYSIFKVLLSNLLGLRYPAACSPPMARLWSGRWTAHNRWVRAISGSISGPKQAGMTA